MKKYIALIIILILSINPIISQSNNDKARAYFTQAKSSYSSGDYTKTIESLNSAEQLLGSTNPVILNLKIKSYYNLKQYDDAKESLNQFSKVSGNADTKLKDETLSYIIKIDDAIKEEAARKERARLAEVKRKEDVRLAEIKRKEERTKRQEEINAKYVSFKRKYNIETNNFLSIEKGGKIELLSKEGKSLLSSKYYSSYPYPFHISGTLFSIRTEQKKDGYYLDSFYLIDVKDGKFLLKDMKAINKLKEGYAIVEKHGGKKAFIDSKGKIVSNWYDDLTDFKEGMSRVGIENGKVNNYFNRKLKDYGFIDKSFKEVISIIYDSALEFSEGLALVVKYGKCGFINKKGETVIPFIYESAYSFKNGKALVSKSKRYKGKKFYINTSGKKVGKF